MSGSAEEWIAAMKAKGHVPIMEAGRFGDPDRLDIWVMSADYHNGPGCSSCGESWCHHCYSPSDIGECDNPVLEMSVNAQKRLK